MIDSAQLEPSKLHSGKLIRLKTLLSHVRGFNALILQHNNPGYRDQLINWLAMDHPEQLLIDIKDCVDFPDFEQVFEQKASATAFLHIINFESLSEAQQQAFYRGLNYHREHVAEVAKATTVLFWLPEPMIRGLALSAPDFWAWREQVFDFSLPVEMPEQRWTANFENTSNLDKERKLQRIQEITDYLAGLSEGDTSSISTTDLRHELGNLYERMGSYDQAKEQLQLALTAFRELDEKHAYARVLRDIADIQFRQGNPAEALNTLETKVLPWFVKLGDLDEQAETYDRVADIDKSQGRLDRALDIRKNTILPILKQTKNKKNAAITMGKIADILQARGQLDDALAIHKNDELPVYEQLGDVRSKAVTMGQIADILQARGQLDDALAIRKNDELSVYEQLGDVRSKAVTMGKIADILQAKGQLDESLKIRKDEHPIYEQLGDVRSLLIGRVELALLLKEIDAKENAQQIQELLNLALTEAQRLQIPEAKWVESVMRQITPPNKPQPT